jgi:hypothetical protein
MFEVMMKTSRVLTGIVAGIAVAVTSLSAGADQRIRCESEDYAYQECPIGKHGYVRLNRQLSDASCKQGRTWDYDRRSIWVDDGCAAEFLVERRHHTDDHPDHSGEKAVAAVAALALLAAAAAASDDPHHKYDDDRYGRGGHTSYMPGWMVGDFIGYNIDSGTEVALQIGADSRARARVNGINLTGYVNDERLYIGDLEFDIERAGRGFNTIQIGDSSNRVHYQRK